MLALYDEFDTYWQNGGYKKISDIIFAECHIFIVSNLCSWRTANFQISEMTTHTPCARDIWWTLDFASAFLSPGVNSRAELVPSPRANARNSAPRRWLGDYLSTCKVWTKNWWHEVPDSILFAWQTFYTLVSHALPAFGLPKSSITPSCVEKTICHIYWLKLILSLINVYTLEQ
jgi:hypothetical protein